MDPGTGNTATVASPVQVNTELKALSGTVNAGDNVITGYFNAPEATREAFVRLYDEGLAKLSFWLTFVGTALTFFPMHLIGLLGMPRRVYTYPADSDWGTLNLVATGGGVLITGAVLIFGGIILAVVRG